MENVSFTFEDAQRISNAVLASERSKYAVKPVDLTSQADELVIINVTATTKYADGTQDGNLSFWNEITHLYAAYDPTQTVRVRAANTADTLPTGYVFARFQGVTSRSGVVGPLYIAVTVRPSGGSATIEVVTDVICTPTGIEVSTVTLSGADYDNAVIRQFLSLSDVTPASYLGNQGRVVKVNDAATALEFGALTDVTASTFIALTDTPSVWGSNAYKVLTVGSGSASVTFSANNITTTKSLSGGGNPNDPAYVALSLLNDETSPGNNRVYGTTSAGVKGWRTLQLTTLTDFPSTTGHGGKFVKVNSGGTGLTYTAVDIQAMLDAITDLTARVVTLEGA